MRVQHNIPAMNAYRNYNNNSSGINKNLEKLSSGYKINRAGDDAAGLAISEKMRAQITGLEVAQKNAKDGISLVQTAEGALTEVQDMLNRMYKLAEQSANGTFDDNVDRKQLDKEVSRLRDEIDRIATTANFNGTKLLDGTLGASGSNGVNGDADVNGDNDVNNDTPATPTATVSDTTNIASITLGSNGAAGDDIKYKVEAEQDGNKAIATLTVGSTEYTAEITAASTTTLTFNESGGSDQITVELTQEGLDAAKASAATSVDPYLTPNGNENDIAESVIATVDAAQEEGGEEGEAEENGATGSSNVSATTVTTGTTAMGSGDQKITTFDVKGGLVLWVGAEADAANAMDVTIDSIQTSDLVIDKIDISSQEGALNSLQYIEAAINKVSDIRGGLGATQNRLEHTINNLSVMQENMQDAESTIRDTDVAEEMMKYTKNSILVQSAQAMLAQANQLPQGVLQLLQ